MSSSRPPSPPAPPHTEHWPKHEEPDAPLPIGSQYRDDDTQSLVEYDPRPISQDEDIAAEAARPRHAWQAKFRTLWLVNKGMFYVVLSQIFGASMNVIAQVLESESDMDPFQVSLTSYLMEVYLAPYRLITLARFPPASRLDSLRSISEAYL